MALPLDDLSLLDEPGDRLGGVPPASGAPLQLPLELIDEDPDQPRTEFNETSLRELSETIALRGVRQPISVRPHPAIPGRWMLNFGARRLRASRLAGRDVIPAFVDDTADSFDQVIENEQRQSLTPLELALFVQRQQEAGMLLAEIARRLGKSRGYLTFVGALIDAPGWLMDLYRGGSCRGMTELYELRKLHEKAPEIVDAWLMGRAEITRADIAELKARQVTQTSSASPSVDPALRSAASSVAKRSVPNKIDVPGSMLSAPSPSAPAVQLSAARVSADASCTPVVELQALWHGQPVVMQLSARVSMEEGASIEVADSSGLPVRVPLAELEQLRLAVRP